MQEHRQQYSLMDLVLYLAMLIGIPILVVGAAFALVYKFGGVKLLRIVCATIALGCAWLLIAESSAPPAMGNQTQHAASGIVVFALLMVVSFIVAMFPFKPKIARANRASQANEDSRNTE